MTRWFPAPLPATPETLMQRAGYVQHCVENGRLCFHRKLHDPAFPRFHAYLHISDTGFLIDIHFDAADAITHKGNHDKDWAYTGERVHTELGRITSIINGAPAKCEAFFPLGHPKCTTPQQPTKKKGFFGVLFNTV